MGQVTGPIPGDESTSEMNVKKDPQLVASRQNDALPTYTTTQGEKDEEKTDLLQANAERLAKALFESGANPSSTRDDLEESMRRGICGATISSIATSVRELLLSRAP